MGLEKKKVRKNDLQSVQGEALLRSGNEDQTKGGEGQSRGYKRRGDK